MSAGFENSSRNSCISPQAAYFVGYHIVESNLLLVQIKLEAPWFETYERASAVEDFIVDRNEGVVVLTRDGFVRNLDTQASICIDKHHPLLCWTAIVRIGETLLASGWSQNSRNVFFLLLAEKTSPDMQYLSNVQLRSSNFF